MSDTLTSSVKNRIRLNDQTYEMGFSLWNPQGYAFPINSAGIVAFSLEEDSREWFKRGYLIINNKENILERRPNEFVQPKANYKFRNDGRDILFVNIKPLLDSTTFQDPQDILPSEDWELAYTFVIYDVEDIPGDNPKEKAFKLYLWEYDYQIFTETNVPQWNTNEVLYRLNPSLKNKSSILSDEVRKIPTGEAIKSLIKNVLSNRSKPQVFDPEWDPGASKIFYTPPTNNTAITDLDYLFNRHVSSKQTAGDVPLLYRKRYTNEWVLTSLAAELSRAVEAGNAGPKQLEQFFIDSTTNAGSTANSTIIPSLLRTPQYPNRTRNINMGHLSNVKNFQFVDMAALDNIFALTSLPCASNNLKDKKFVLEGKDQYIQNVKNYFQEKYVNSFSNNKEPSAMFTLNKAKLDNFIYKVPYSFGSTKVERYPDSRNRILKTGFFLNQCLSFTVIGSTLRKPNVFIGLDRVSGMVDADFDEKLLGQWYVIKVTHDFTQNGYTNTITAVKPHADRNIRISDTVEDPKIG